MSQETCRFYSVLSSSGVGKVKRGYVLFTYSFFLFVYISYVLHNPCSFEYGFLIFLKGVFLMSQSISSNVSRTIQTKLVLPPDTNHIGTIFGGTVLSNIDEIAAISAMKHSKRVVVTASIDRVNFVSSAKVGDILYLEAAVFSTGRTSMEVYVKVECENLLKGNRRITTTSVLTMVAIDEHGQPVAVPGVIPVTKEEMDLHKHAQERRKQRTQEEPIGEGKEQ
jgi:acyl-CoA hydrolase